VYLFKRISYGLTIFFTSIILGTTTQVEAGGHNKAGENKLVCDLVRDKRIALGDKALVREYSMLLLEASEKGCLIEVTRLIELGALINVKDRLANTPTIRAAQAGQLETLKYLTSHGGRLDQPNLRGATALLKAVKNNRKKTIKWLLSQNVEVNVITLDNETPLSLAAFDGNIQFVKQLLKAGADPAKRDNTGKSALIYSAAKGFHNIVSLLLDAGVDPNEIFINETTPLMWAAGHTADTPPDDALKTVQILLQAGATTLNADNRDLTALDYANQTNHVKIAQLIKNQ
jgi:ankyrin repeat protein